MRRTIVFTVMFIFSLIKTPYSQEIPEVVRAELVSSSMDGGLFQVGVLFNIDPGWHIYWKYPGETGLPTRVKFELPQDYKQGEVKWPVPSIFKKPLGGVDYGYENSLLLWTSVEAPSDLNINKNAGIGAQVSWISCKDICIPGNAELKMNLTDAQKKDSGKGAIFTKWDKLLPVSESPFKIELNKVKIDNARFRVELELEHGPSVSMVNYVPDPGDFILVDNILSQYSQNATSVSFDVRSRDGHDLSGHFLDGLITYSDSNGKHSAVEIKIDFNDN
jgi:DsbC/DsbD-like thiol-disulfide interchange protein